MKRITIVQMLGVIGVVALGLAALRAGTEIWLKAVQSLTLGLLLASLVGAMVRPHGRAAWVGFAVFGWIIYILLNHNLLTSDYSEQFLGHDTLHGAFASFHRAPAPPPGLPPVDSEEFEALRQLYYRVAGQNPFGTPSGINPAFPPYLRAVDDYTERVGRVEAIGDLLVCLAMGVIGAVVGRVLGPRGGRVATMGPGG